jgi:DNA-binding NtrC family response regulator
VFPIEVPPLRARLEDVPLLVWHFVEQFASAYGKTIETVSGESMEALLGHSWPGNIRELRNLVERAVIVAAGPDLTIPVPVKNASAAAGDALVAVEKVAHHERARERRLADSGSERRSAWPDAAKKRHDGLTNRTSTTESGGSSIARSIISRGGSRPRLSMQAGAPESS